MAVNGCPADQVQAPVDVVWALLMNPAGYGRFLAVTIEHVEPGGPAVVGQGFTGWTRALLRRWEVTGKIVAVDTDKHRIQFCTALPLGIMGDNVISRSPIDPKNSFLRFG